MTIRRKVITFWLGAIAVAGIEIAVAALRLTRGGHRAALGLHLTLDRNHEY